MNRPGATACWNSLWVDSSICALYGGGGDGDDNLHKLLTPSTTGSGIVGTRGAAQYSGGMYGVYSGATVFASICRT